MFCTSVLPPIDFWWHTGPEEEKLSSLEDGNKVGERERKNEDKVWKSRTCKRSQEAIPNIFANPLWKCESWIVRSNKEGDNHCREIWAKDVDKNFYKKTDIKKSLQITVKRNDTPI